MTRTTAELKNIIQDGMKITAPMTGREMTIQRCPNNILKLDGRLIKWDDLRDLLLNSELELHIKETQEVLFENKKEWGGARSGAGRPIVKGKKCPVSFGITNDIKLKLADLCDYHNMSKSELVAQLIEQSHTEMELEKE